MSQACAQAVDFKVGHHFGEGQQAANWRSIPTRFSTSRKVSKNS
jgi:hypothetical protein